MSDFYPVGKVPYEGISSKNPFAFRYYNPDEMIAGKSMRDHLRFAMSWWHTMVAGGRDMFGGESADKSFGASGEAIERARVDAGFEMMQKLGIPFYCYHDYDLIQERATLAESNAALAKITAYMLEKQEQTGIGCLWATSNLFSNPRYMHGAGTSPEADVFAYAAGQVKQNIDCAIKLGAQGLVFWGGREGYETLLNTDMALELDNLARFLRMAIDYARAHGFKGDFYIEPKPKEPTKHQYDFDAATTISFLRKYNLDKDMKLNIECNHATLAGHTFEHELRTAAVNGMLGSIDANQGDMLIGWDTDQFPTDVYTTTYCMLEVLRAGGFDKGGLNFDAKNRRGSHTPEDVFYAYIAGMDAYALGLRLALKIQADGRLDEFVRERYQSWRSGIGQDIVSGKATLQSLSDYALELPALAPKSGRQEYLENLVNSVIFGGK